MGNQVTDHHLHVLCSRTDWQHSGLAAGTATNASIQKAVDDEVGSPDISGRWECFKDLKDNETQ